MYQIFSNFLRWKSDLFAHPQIPWFSAPGSSGIWERLISLPAPVQCGMGERLLPLPPQPGTVSAAVAPISILKGYKHTYNPLFPAKRRPMSAMGPTSCPACRRVKTVSRRRRCALTVFTRSTERTSVLSFSVSSSYGLANRSRRRVACLLTGVVSPAAAAAAAPGRSSGCRTSAGDAGRRAPAP